MQVFSYTSSKTNRKSSIGRENCPVDRAERLTHINRPATNQNATDAKLERLEQERIKRKDGITMNNGNLKPCRNTEEAKERGRLGGLASGRSRRQRSRIAKAMQTVMKKKIPSGEIRERLKVEGIDLDEKATNEVAFAASVLVSAMQGNMQAARLVLELVGEDPQFEHKKEVDEAAIELKQKALDAAHDVDPFYEPIQFIMPPKRPPFDLSKLTDDERETFEILSTKAQPDTLEEADAE